MARITRAPCAICGGRLGGVRVRLAPGQVWQGPYRRCDVCGANFHTEHGVLVPSDETWMLAPSVLEVLDALRAADLDAWLDGGWGVDALVGEETRAHGDVDIVIELDRVDDVLVALAPLGFTMAEDHLPTRAVLRTLDGRQVDLHPVTFDADGTGWQRAAAPDGSDCPYPAGGFGHGVVGGRAVPCLTAALQLEHHRGYEPRPRDLLDIALLEGLLTPPG